MNSQSVSHKFERARSYLVKNLVSKPNLVEIIDEVFDFALAFQIERAESSCGYSGKKPQIIAVCGSCDYQWIVGFSGTLDRDLQALLARVSICARCLECTNIRYHDLFQQQNASSKNAVANNTPIFRHKG